VGECSRLGAASEVMPLVGWAPGTFTNTGAPRGAVPRRVHGVPTRRHRGSSSAARGRGEWSSRGWWIVVRARCRAGLRHGDGGLHPDRRRTLRAELRTDRLPQRLPHPTVGHPGRHDRTQDPQGHRRRLLPLTARAPPASGEGAARAAKYDGREVTKAARLAFTDRWTREVDPKDILSERERERRARAAMCAHMQRLALRSAQVRRRRTGNRQG
jgi:hypothetical protein